MKRFSRLLAALGAVAALLVANAAVATAISDGETVSFTLKEGQSTNNYYIQVPAGATYMRVLLETDKLKDDVDMYLRYDKPFDQSESLNAQSLYYSRGNTGTEFLTLTYANNPPVSAGRWYLLVKNYAGEGESGKAKITLTVSIQSKSNPTLKPLDIKIVYLDDQGTGFYDTSSLDAKGGNKGTTLGEARRIAFEKAISILEESFTSPVPIIVAARWVQPESVDTGGGTPLAYAGPTFYAYNFPGAPVAGVWYVASVIPRLAGTSSCRLYKYSFDANYSCTKPLPDFSITFFADPPKGWYYGLNPAGEGRSGYDFVSTATHELLHGLGFLSLVDVETGKRCCKGNRRDDIFSSQLYWLHNGERLAFDELTRKQRKRAMTSVDKLRWGGEYALTEWEDLAPLNKLIMYAPAEPNPGSSVSHTDFVDLMMPTAFTDFAFRGSGPELGAAYFFLRDTGWSAEAEPKLEPSGPTIHRGLYYDRSRSGHGFDFQRANESAWSLLFYTFNKQGDPVWYLSVLKESSPNVFTGDLYHYVYKPDGDGQPQEGTRVGSVTVDFTATASSDVCQDGVDRSGAIALARFSWSINATSGDWCVEPLISGDGQLTPDFTGTWYAGRKDTGWGMSIAHAKSGSKQILGATVYYYDAQGNPRWAQALFTAFGTDNTAKLFEYEGYARTTDCSKGCDTRGRQQAGTLSLKLVEPSRSLDAGNRATLDVTYQGDIGGDWVRTDVPIALLTEPVPQGN